jgi:integrase/recombinase XerD
MASLTRRTYRDPRTGEKKTAATWYGKYTDASGKRVRVPLSENKAAAAKMLDDLVKQVELERAGIRNRSVECAAMPLTTLLDEYRQHHADRGNTTKQANLAVGRCQAVFAACRFHLLRDVDSAKVEQHLARRRQLPRSQNGIGPQTSNHICTALVTFGNWLLRTRRLSDNPFIHLPRVNPKLDVRHVRRSLSDDEFRWLLATVRTSGRLRKFTGPQREALYATAAYTGLRASELASLTRVSFAFDAAPPTVTVEAAYSKHRRKDVVPLHASLVSLLRGWLPTMPTDGPLWPGKWTTHSGAAVNMIRRDLAAARSAWIASANTTSEREQRAASDFLKFQTAEGKADFHSLRHRFVTELVKAGVQPKDAKELARHSTIVLTMDRYAHVQIQDSAAALNKLSGGSLAPPLAPADWANPGFSKTIEDSDGRTSVARRSDLASFQVDLGRLRRIEERPLPDSNRGITVLQTAAPDAICPEKHGENCLFSNPLAPPLAPSPPSLSELLSQLAALSSEQRAAIAQLLTPSLPAPHAKLNDELPPGFEPKRA